MKRMLQARYRQATTGFTLAELLVSMGLSLIIMGVVGYAMHNCSKASTQAIAMIDLHQRAAALATTPSGDPNGVLASTCVAGKYYVIIEVGTTNFKLIGAVDNKVQLKFKATDAGIGTGKVRPLEKLDNFNKIFSKGSGHDILFFKL